MVSYCPQSMEAQLGYAEACVRLQKYTEAKAAVRCNSWLFRELVSKRISALYWPMTLQIRKGYGSNV